MKHKSLAFLVIFFLLSNVAEAGVTIREAIRGGCYGGQQIKAIYDVVVGDGLGSVTRQKMKYYFSGSFSDNAITKNRVTAPDTWVFRGDDAPDSSVRIQKLKEGFLYSKAQKRVDDLRRQGGNISEFWQSNGPELKKNEADIRNPLFLMMRLLAIQTSDTPPSQFISVGLTLDTASTFGDPVYAFQVNPDSPILGIRNCQVSGEDQFQILGGTEIQALHRKRRAISKWEKYDSKTKGWVEINGRIPPE